MPRLVLRVAWLARGKIVHKLCDAIDADNSGVHARQDVALSCAELGNVNTPAENSGLVATLDLAMHCPRHKRMSCKSVPRNQE